MQQPEPEQQINEASRPALERLAALFQAVVTSSDSKTTAATSMVLISAGINLGRHCGEKQRKWIRAHTHDELAELDEPLH